jgi:hypothetical protein
VSSRRSFCADDDQCRSAVVLHVRYQCSSSMLRSFTTLIADSTAHSIAHSIGMLSMQHAAEVRPGSCLGCSSALRPESSTDAKRCPGVSPGFCHSLDLRVSSSVFRSS